jgi:hypothetical protein
MTKTKEIEAPLTELDVQEIENRIVSKKLKELTGVPRVIRRQLSRIGEDALKAFNIDTVYTADVQLKIFRTVANSSLTLDVMGALIKQHKENPYRVKFDRFLKRAVKNAKKYRKEENNEVDLKQKLKEIISGKAKRVNAEA